MKQTQVIAAILLIVLPFGALAEPYYNTRGTWKLEFSGIPFAKLWIALEEDEATYKLTASFKSRGIVSLFKKMKTYSESQGVRLETGIQPLVYRFQNELEPKQTSLAFDRDGNVIERLVEPEDDPWHRPPIPLEDVRGAQSVGSIVFTARNIMRQQLRQVNDEASFQLYDGKRLATIMLQYVGEKNVELNGQIHNVHVVQLSRKMINGFTQKEIKRAEEGDPPVFLYMRQGDFFPIGMQAEIRYGTLSAYWEEEKPKE